MSTFFQTKIPKAIPLRVEHTHLVNKGGLPRLIIYNFIIGLFFDISNLGVVYMNLGWLPIWVRMPAQVNPSLDKCLFTTVYMNLPGQMTGSCNSYRHSCQQSLAVQAFYKLILPANNEPFSTILITVLRHPMWYMYIYNTYQT